MTRQMTDKQLHRALTAIPQDRPIVGKRTAGLPNYPGAEAAAEAAARLTPRTPLAYGIYKRQNVGFSIEIEGTTTSLIGIALMYRDDYFTVHYVHPITGSQVNKRVYKTDITGLNTESGQPWIDGENPSQETMSDRERQDRWNAPSAVAARAAFEKATHGGSRTGAGRKPKFGTTMRPHTIRLTDTQLTDILEHYESLSDFIEHAVNTL